MPDGDPLATPPSRGRSTAWLRWTVVVLGAIVAAIAALSLIRVEGEVGPGRVSVRAGFDRSPETRIGVPPLGELAFATHRAPLTVSARIESVDPAAVQDLALDDPAASRLDDATADQLRRLLVGWGWRAGIAGAVAGGLTATLLWPRRVLPPLVGAGVGLASVLALLGATSVDFSRDALRDPEYRGALERAPEVLAAIDREWGGLGELPDRLRILARNITDLYTTAGLVESTTEKRAGEVRILHVSDIHSNPVGLELVRALADGFEVDAIIDTGDFTSFGLPVESAIGTLIRDMPAPYFLVPGNHDTPANRAALAEFANLTVLDGDIVEIAGLRVLGVADPAVTADGEDSDDAANAKRDAQAPLVARLVARGQPDVLAVATPRQAAASTGRVPLVITGNSHRRSERVIAGTRVLAVGSTGATGLGALTRDTDLPYEAQLLRFRDGRLTTVDYVTLEGIDGDYTVSRRVIPAPSR